MEIWQNNIRAIRKYLCSLAKHTAGHYEKEKKKHIFLIESLNKKAEITTLTDNEINWKHYLKERLVSLLREAKMKWYERVKVKKLLRGDINTWFFHLVVKGKHRKQHIIHLEQQEVIIAGDEQLKFYITIYYKGLFGPLEVNGISLQEDQIEDIPQVSQHENEILNSPFPQQEAKDVVFQIEHNKTPGPDGIPTEFY